MIKLRASDDRGRADFGWLDSRHSFSFGHYLDPEHMGFGPLRVINEDRVVPGRGFDTHGHRDMEILSYVLDGALEHTDSLGNGSIIRPGELQRMTAGTGVRHSEYNASNTEPVHFLQIWILPEAEGLAPGYEQTAFPLQEQRGRLHLIASRDGREGSVTVHQDLNLYAGVFDAGETLEFALKKQRLRWLQLVRGQAELAGLHLHAGDGVAIQQAELPALTISEQSELLLFDMGNGSESGTVHG